MMHTAIYRSDKICSQPRLRAALEHNKRENPVELATQLHIDQSRCVANWSVTEPCSSADVLARMKARMHAAGVGTLRRDAVRAIELIFSLPNDHTIDERDFFQACVDWAASEFGGEENVLSADVHLDESNPHCHVLIVPLVGGRMNGSELYGYRPALTRRLAAFFDRVAGRFGFVKPAPALKGKQKMALADRVLKELSEDPARQSPVWEGFRALIKANPEPLAALLKLKRPTTIKKLRTVAQIMTSRGKGAKSHEEEARRCRKPTAGRAASKGCRSGHGHQGRL